ncbi:hypothetical protein RvY_15841 [Ramazzottius varieornatus]|uniref:Cystatin domain-containing protein n=1 Tax=Ramazzottius varieornatus TaxID=947166 RepID=A0A1D1VXG0_RAMVA|nr:hypothetical protein RvY_15841 [Ramazzottius varieornatus]
MMNQGRATRGPISQVPQNVQKLAELVRHKVEGRTGPSEEYIVVAYKVQEVGPGTYTSFKIRADNERYVHAEVYQSSPDEEPTLTGLERSRNAWDPLVNVSHVSDH